MGIKITIDFAINTLVCMAAAVDAGLPCINTCYDDPASLQLPCYKASHKDEVHILTTANGAPVEVRDTLALNADLMSKQYFVEILTHTMRSRIPERHVHVKGAGAFGYFEVTNDTFSKYCKAEMFSKVGKKTPLVVRFSPSSEDKGESDTMIDTRGFAVKFYTLEGNFDLVMFNTPLFTYREPFLVDPVVKVIRRNPVTNLRDPHMLWDLICEKPEVLPLFLFIFGDNGIPKGFRHMPGHSIHTYQVYNCDGESTFCRFVAKPTLGVKNLYLADAVQIGCKDPDYAVRDLYNAIARGEFPTYTFGVQCLTYEQVKKCPFDVFDVTKILPEKDYPVKPVGRIVLNRNPTNFHADVEQAAFCPSNMVPGILGAPDNIFVSRSFAYKDAQRYRLGVNFEDIPVNRPRNKVYTYNRDGRPPVPTSGTDGPNFYPNSFGGPVPYVDNKRPNMIKITQRNNQYEFGQSTDIYNSLNDDERNRMASNICAYLVRTYKDLQQRVLNLLGMVSKDLKYRVSL